MIITAVQSCHEYVSTYKKFTSRLIAFYWFEMPGHPAQADFFRAEMYLFIPQ